ncbi:MAG: hypothetical protein PVI75_01960 [Gammaproteobacteria bacterium]
MLTEYAHRFDDCSDYVKLYIITICYDYLLNYINTYLIICFILHTLKERKNKLKMQADINLLQQKIKEINIAKEFADAKKRTVENKIDVLEKQIAKLKQQLKNCAVFIS